mmetsp:Transcript_1393/g.2182  ORF Transcript_1393/g.2182 Transcript_1393/m.2182 type:complete len:81 (+) Transcript_1393:491-733(+)
MQGESMRVRIEKKLQVREELMQQGLPIDVLFGAGAWEVMKTRTDFLQDRSFALVYYHCGGLGGDEYFVESFRKFLAESTT